MSEDDNLITEEIYTLPDEENKNNELENTYQLTKSQQSKRTQTYKYVYTNINNKKNITEKANNINQINIYKNSNNIPKRRVLSTSNLFINPNPPSPSNNNCETNYSLNKISNVRYVNGENKYFSKINYIRSPDIKFKSHEKNETSILRGNDDTINTGEIQEECICDRNLKCTCGKRKYNIRLYEEEQGLYSNHVNKNVNHKKNIVKRNYYMTDRNINNTNNKYNNTKSVKIYGKTNILQTNPVIFSNNNNINSEYTNNTSKTTIKYSSPKNNTNRITKERIYYYNKNCNTIDDLRKQNLNNINNRYSMPNNTNNIKICSCSRNSKTNTTKHNYNFKSITNCSNRNRNTSRSYLNSFSSQKNGINTNNYSSSKYKYNLCIHNINVNKGMNRSVSYETLRNNRRKMSNVFSSDEDNNNYNIESNELSPHKKNLKIQNAQKMEVIQNEKSFQVLVPIPQNKIDYACDMQINNNGKNKYSVEEINEIKKRKKIQTTKIINESNYNNKEKEELITFNRRAKKKPNWNLTNKAINENNISYRTNKKIEIDNTQKKKDVQNIKDKNEFNMENFEINISDNGRKFKGEMLIENKSIEFEKQPKDLNLNLLLSPNQTISLNAYHPRRDWNSITRPTSIRPLSIEGRHKEALLERSVEKLSIKGDKPKNDWNICNNEKKEVNINLYQKKKTQYLSKQRMQPFVIIGNDKKWNFITRKENETNLTVIGVEKKNDTIENDDEIIVNDDYNKIENNHNRHVRTNIQKITDISDESSSEYNVLNNLKMINAQNNKYKDAIQESYKKSGQKEGRVIINDISRKYPKRVETYHGIDEEEITNYQNINNINNVDGINNNNKKIYSKKIINTYQKKNVNLTEVFNNNSPSSQKKSCYREEIKIEFKDYNQQEQQNGIKYTITKEKDDNNYNNENQSLILTPKSQTKYSYREEIISLSPYSEKQNEIFYNMNRNSYQTLNNTGNTGQNSEFVNIYNTHLIQNENPNINQASSYYKVQSEQEIPSIQEDDNQMTNNFSYTQEIITQDQGQQQKMKFIYKKSNQNLNNNTHNFNNYKPGNMDNINNNVYLPNNKINGQEINQKQISIKNNINNNQYNNNYLIKGKKYNHTVKEIAQDTTVKQNQKIITEDSENISESKMNEFDSNIIINKSQVVKSNDLSNLNNCSIQERIELCKSQEIVSPSTPSQHQLRKRSDNKYFSYIQQYSHYLKNNPIDNYNNFPTNKYNIMPMSSGRYDNIILNNKLSNRKKSDLNEKTNHVKLFSNITNDNNLNIKNNNQIVK